MMKFLKRVFLGLLCAAASLVAAVVAVHTWYHFTPVEYSDETKALNERAKLRPTITENGYRLYGFEAPREVDPVVYGRCLFDAYWANSAERPWPAGSGPVLDTAEAKAAWAADTPAREARAAQRTAACAGSFALLTLPGALSKSTLNLATPRQALSQLAAIVPDPVLLERATQITAAGRWRLGASLDSPQPLPTALASIARWRLATAAVAWDAGHRAEAIDGWSNAVRVATGSADNTLIDLMMSTSQLSQTLIVVQQSVAATQTLDAATANQLLALLQPMEAMPQAVADAMLAEWQVRLSSFEWMRQSLDSGHVAQASWGERALARVAALFVDTNDTMNLMARGNLWVQRTASAAARGGPEASLPAEYVSWGCDSVGEIGVLCIPFVRNPLGRVTATIALPHYGHYGVRVSDLMNLANATRLSISVRQRGLTGPALEKWIAEAPAEMRDISSQQPFRYDANERKLHVNLRTSSHFLGKGPSYALPL